MVVLLQITQIVASGGKVDIKHCLGDYECSPLLPVLFERDATMRSSGSKSDLIKVLKDETNASTTEQLPSTDNCTSVIIDAMGLIRRSPFQKDESFADYAIRLKNQILDGVPHSAGSIHLCRDRY